MASKVSPTLIGSFVVGGIVLLVGALFVFGRGDLFKERNRWVTYFDGSVAGLTIGAPVTFRGVRVGKVTDVALQLDTRTVSARIPVYFEIEADRITWGGAKSAPSSQAAAAAGLRAKLALQSIVTGQLVVELDLLPDTPARLVGADPLVPEIASVPSDLEALKRQISDLPLHDLVVSIDTVVKRVDALVASPEIRQTMAGLAATLMQTERLLATLNEDARPLIREFTATARSARRTSEQAARSLRSIDRQTQATLRSAERALRQVSLTMASINGLVADDTQGRQDIEDVLQNLAEATTALRSFADTVERNPNALIVGR